MKWFLKVFLRWVGKRRAAPTLPAVPLCGEWTPDDRAFLQRFLVTPTGFKLQQRWCAVAFKASRDAAKDPVSPIHSVGRASGFMDALDWLQSLSISSSEPDVIDSESEAADQGDTRNLESAFAET